MPKRSVVPSTCHPERREFAKGLCQRCYTQARRPEPAPAPIATCHPDRPHKAKGLCAQCYSQLRTKGRRTGARPADCHPDKPNVGDGLCQSCYMQRWRLAHRPKDWTAPIKGTPTCHPERPYKAHGLCAACYEVARQQKLREKFPKPPKPQRMADCHPDEPYFARGMCRLCYTRAWAIRDRRATCHPDRPEYAKSLCKICYNKPYDAGRSRARSLRKNYGADAPDWYDERFAVQHGLCAICSQPPRGSGRETHLAVDHDHDTGLRRGLLCQRCNRALGLFGDSIDNLEAAIRYLQALKP